MSVSNHAIGIRFEARLTLSSKVFLAISGSSCSGKNPWNTCGALPNFERYVGDNVWSSAVGAATGAKSFHSVGGVQVLLIAKYVRCVPLLLGS